MYLRYGTPEEAGLYQDRVDYFDKFLTGWVEDGVSPAIVMLLARNGVIGMHKAYGKLTPEADSLTLPLDAIYPMASISKPLTAMCLLSLVEDGLVDLNTPVQKYIPQFKGEGKDKVFIYHLLTHSSGIKDEDVYEFIENKKKNGPVEYPKFPETQHPRIGERLYSMYDAPLSVKPGTEMNYSSLGYDLIGEIIRRKSGKSLNDYSREKIFKPLGMDSTYFAMPESMIGRVVQRPADAPGYGYYGTADHLAYPSASGGALSCASDLAKLGQMMLNKGTYNGKRILSPASIALMTTNQIPGISSSFEGFYFKEAGWSIGWNMREKKIDDCGCLRSPSSFQHTGAGGVTLTIDPEYNFIVVYLSVAMQSPYINKKYGRRIAMASNVAYSCLK